MDVNKDKVIEPHEFNQVIDWFLKEIELDVPK